MDPLELDPYLYQIAASLGITIVLTFSGLKPGWWGGYDHKRQRIHIRPGLEAAQQRYALAHELGHAVYSHTKGGEDPAQEAEARHFAARLVVNAEKVAALRACGFTDDRVARLLKVPGEALRDFDRYVSPRPAAAAPVRRTYNYDAYVEGAAGHMATPARTHAGPPTGMMAAAVA